MRHGKDAERWVASRLGRPVGLTAFILGAGLAVGLADPVWSTLAACVALWGLASYAEASATLRGASETE